MRTLLDELIGEADLKMKMEGAGAASGGTCIKTYTVDGFGYAKPGLTWAQKGLIATIAGYILAGAGGVPPLARVKEVRIVGFASGTRNLDIYAWSRAMNVSDELIKHLLDLGATEEDLYKITFGVPVTKPVKTQTAADPHFRKVVICIQ